MHYLERVTNLSRRSCYLCVNISKLVKYITFSEQKTLAFMFNFLRCVCILFKFRYICLYIVYWGNCNDSHICKLNTHISRHLLTSFTSLLGEYMGLLQPIPYCTVWYIDVSYVRLLFSRSLWYNNSNQRDCSWNSTNKDKY